MLNAGKALFPLLAVGLLTASDANAAELTLRQMLLENPSVQSLYSVDEHTTMIAASGKTEALSAISGLCSAKGASLAAENDTVKCADAFSAEPTGAEGRSYILKSPIAEPIAYKTPSVPPYEELETPSNGRMEGAFDGIDMYQYMYALCKKGNGKAFTVISRRTGRVVRLVEASPAETFRHLLTMGNGKDPWFFACEGETKFIVQKDYGYGENDKARFTFYQNRGLEWVDFVKSGDKDDLARLDSFDGELQNSTHDPAVLAGMAREVASFRSDMVKAVNGARYEGHYLASLRKDGCDFVAINDGSRTFNYRVCGYDAAAVDPEDMNKGRGILERLSGR